MKLIEVFNININGGRIMVTDCVKINIEEIIHSNLGMNSSARNLFKELNNSPADNITIDFSNVIFMSRSFTQEYLFQKLNSHKHIIEQNVPDNVQKMFDVVKKDFE